MTTGHLVSIPTVLTVLHDATADSLLVARELKNEGQT